MVGRNAGLRYPKHVYSKTGKTFFASVFIGFRQEFGPKRNSIAEAQADLPPMLERQRWAIAQRKHLGFLARPASATQPASEVDLTALEERTRQQKERDLSNAHFLRTNGGRLPKYVYKQRSKFRATVCIRGRTASAPGRDTILEAQSANGAGHPAAAGLQEVPNVVRLNASRAGRTTDPLQVGGCV